MPRIFSTSNGRMQPWLHSHAPTANDELLIARKLTAAVHPTSHCALSSQAVLARNQASHCIVLAPTGAGKTAHAVAFAEDALLAGGSVLCIAPYHTLIDELFDHMQHAFQGRGFVCGRLAELTPPQAARVDVCLGTPEQALKLLLQPAAKTTFTGIIIDEVHHALEPGARAERLQAVLMLVKRLNARRSAPARVLGLSATMHPDWALRFAHWLPCSLLYCCIRSVPLHVSKFQGGSASLLVPSPALPQGTQGATAHAFKHHSVHRPAACDVLGHIASRAAQGARVVLFVSTRKAAAHTAKALAAKLPAGSVMHHHAGLSHSQRAAAVRGFRGGSVRALVATTTLAMGVNLPASDVVVLSGAPHDKQHGTFNHKEWSLLQQQVGRAGRWGLQPHGRCVLTLSSVQAHSLSFLHPLAATPPSAAARWNYIQAGASWRAAEAVLLAAFMSSTPVSTHGCLAAVQSALPFTTASLRQCATQLTQALCILRACDFVDVHHDARHSGAAPRQQVRFTLSKGGGAAALALPVCPLQDFIRVVQFACASTPPQVLPLDAASPERRLGLLLGSAPSGASSSDTAFALAPLRRMGRSFDWQVLRTWLSIAPKATDL